MVAPISPRSPVSVVRCLVSFETKKDHVGGQGELRNLERHRNDHAQNRAADHNGCSDFAHGRRCQLALEPGKRTKRQKSRLRSQLRLIEFICRGGPSIIATADAPMRNKLGSGFSTSIRTGNAARPVPSSVRA